MVLVPPLLIGITGRSSAEIAPLGPWKLVALIVPLTSRVAAGAWVLIPTRFSLLVYELPRASSDLTSITVAFFTLISTLSLAPPNSIAPLAVSYPASCVYVLAALVRI